MGKVKTERVSYQQAQRILAAKRLRKDLNEWRAMVAQWGTMERLEDHIKELEREG